jgi:predicted transcriptional regulator
MSTTTVRLPDELRARIESLAVDAGLSVHALMIQALDEATERMARERDFHAEALERLEHMERTGEYIELDDLRRYAMALAAGDPSPPRPEVRRRAVARKAGAGTR